MKAKITKAFKFAVGGNHVIEVTVGQVVEGRCAEVALAEKWGVPHGESPAPEKAPIRLPLLEEYVAAGYKAEEYEAFIAGRTAAAVEAGVEVIVAPPPPELEEQKPATQAAPAPAEIEAKAPEAPASEPEKKPAGKASKGKGR